MIAVHEEFYSLQGEGRHTGMAAYFVRLAGCDVGCPWCDSADAWSGGTPMDEVEVAARAKASGARMAIITGGEPLMQNLDALTAELHRCGLAVHLETSGTHPLSGGFDWICLSPKRHRPPIFFDDLAVSVVSELKVVVGCGEDLEWAEECAARVGSDCLLYLQPEWNAQATQLVVDYILRNPRWRLSLQTHKYIGIE